MAVQLSQAELLADLEEFHENTTQTQVPRRAPPTEKGYNRMVKLWTDYTCRLGQPGMTPTLASIKGFFKTLARENKGYLGPKLSLQTLDAYLVRFVVAQKEEHGHAIPDSIITEVREWMWKDLKQQLNLSSKARPKPMAASQELGVLLRYLWAEDRHVFKQEHFRVQLALYLLILSYTAARPGTLVVSDAYRNSEEALKFRDLKLCLHRDEDGGPPSKSLTVTFNLMKGDRDKEDEFVSITLWEDRLFPHLCPIMPFLSLAFKYGALDLEADHLFRPTLDRDVVEVNFREAVLNEPVFRAVDGVRAWMYSGCNSALTKLAYRAGYDCRVTSYNIRRGAANVLDKSCTWTEKGLALGHKNPKVLQAKYANRHLEVNIQALFHGRVTQMTRQMGLLRGMAGQYFPGAPTSLHGTPYYWEVRNHPEYLELRREYLGLKRAGESKPLIDAARYKMKFTLNRLSNNETKRYRAAWIRDNGKRSLTAQAQDQDGPQPEALEDSLVLSPWRAEVVDFLFRPVESLDQSLQLLRSLCTLLSVQKGATDLARMAAIARFSCTGTAGNASEDSRAHPREPREYKRFKARPRPKNYFCLRPDCSRSQKPFWNKRDLARHSERIHAKALHFCSHRNCLRRRKGFTNEGSLLRHLREAHFENSTSNSDGGNTGADAGRTEPITRGIRQQYYGAEGNSPAEVVAELVYNVETGKDEWMKVGRPD